MVATWWNFAKKQAIICLEALLFLLHFTGGFSSGKTHIADCCFVSRSYWCTQVSSPVTMSQTRGDLPPSNVLSMRLHQSTLPRFCSHSGYGTLNGYNVSLRQGCREEKRVRLPDEIFMISCISAYAIFGSFLIRDSTIGTSSGVTVVAIRPQRSSSSNVLAPDMNCLNHLKIVASGGDWSPKQCFKLWERSWNDFPWH